MPTECQVFVEQSTYYQKLQVLTQSDERHLVYYLNNFGQSLKNDCQNLIIFWHFWKSMFSPQHAFKVQTYECRGKTTKSNKIGFLTTFMVNYHSNEPQHINTNVHSSASTRTQVSRSVQHAAQQLQHKHKAVSVTGNWYHVNDLLSHIRWKNVSTQTKQLIVTVAITSHAADTGEREVKVTCALVGTENKINFMRYYSKVWNTHVLISKKTWA